MDIKGYWAAVDRKLAEIRDEWPWVTSIEDPSRGVTGGAVMQMDRESAARAMVEGKGRLATPGEIEAELERSRVALEAVRERDRAAAALRMVFGEQRVQAAAEPKKK